MQDATNRPLTIVYLSDKPQRVENAKFIIKNMFKGNAICCKNSISSRSFDSIETATEVYRFIDLSDKMKNYDLPNLKADQVIVDCCQQVLDIAKKLLKDSCVPEEFQVIDDRDLGVTMLPPWLI